MTPTTTQLMFSSVTDKWDTPQTLVDDLATVFDWDLDVCASSPNVCANYYTETDNAFYQPRSGLIWMNPPYGRNIKHWVYMAYCDANIDKLASYVCLLPARTDTRWWQENITYASQVVFIKGRLKFGNAISSAPFPSAFVVFGEIAEDQRRKLGSYGWSVSL